MQLEQRQTLSQKLVLTQTMRQSLDCLQLSAPELSEYVQEVALSNPLLDVQSPTYYETELPSEAAPAAREPLEVREADSWRGVTSSGMEDVQDFTAFLTREKTFRDHLTEQIGQMKLVDDELLRLCRFLIDCLDERGYLDCPLEELSREFDIPLFSLEQALFAVQMLDQPGVGARNLSDCLTLQHAQERSLDPLALKIARDGLELLGKRNFSSLAVLLGVSVGEARAAAAKILALNPIPSRSFAGSEQIAYVAPDAEYSEQQGQLVIELNARILPPLSVNAHYAALMNSSDDPEVQRYVKEKLSEAQALIKGVHTRCDTLVQMLTLIGREQHGFFCGGEALLPVTMQQLSEKMGVSTSTVSRAAQNKYIQFQGRIIPVRSFFTTAIRPAAAVSSHAVKQRLQSLIRAEDPAAPLSDEALRLALSALGIEVSRRAIAKYRAEMDIPSSSQRKKRCARGAIQYFVRRSMLLGPRLRPHRHLRPLRLPEKGCTDPLPLAGRFRRQAHSLGARCEHRDGLAHAAARAARRLAVWLRFERQHARALPQKGGRAWHRHRPAAERFPRPDVSF